MIRQRLEVAIKDYEEEEENGNRCRGVVESFFDGRLWVMRGVGWGGVAGTSMVLVTLFIFFKSCQRLIHVPINTRLT